MRWLSMSKPPFQGSFSSTRVFRFGFIRFRGSRGRVKLLLISLRLIKGCYDVMYFYHYCTVSHSQSVSVNVKQKENSHLTAAIDAVEVYRNFLVRFPNRDRDGQ